VSGNVTVRVSFFDTPSCEGASARTSAVHVSLSSDSIVKQRLRPTGTAFPDLAFANFGDASSTRLSSRAAEVNQKTKSRSAVPAHQQHRRRCVVYRRVDFPCQHKCEGFFPQPPPRSDRPVFLGFAREKSFPDSRAPLYLRRKNAVRRGRWRA